MGLVGIVLTESPPDLLDTDAGVIEEARQRQRRHRGMAAVTLAGAAGFAAIMLGFFGGGNATGGRGQPSTRPHPASLTVPTVAPSTVLADKPYIGIACPGPAPFNAARAIAIARACSRAGMSIVLRAHAVTATATINGQTFELERLWSFPSGPGKHMTLVGFLHPARFLHGPFKTVTFRNGIHQRFTVENLHLVIDYGAGHQVQTSMQELGYGAWG